MVDDYAIVGSHIGNSPGFLFNGIMIRRENAFIVPVGSWDLFKPINFYVGNMFTFHSVQFIDNQVCASDCFNDRPVGVQFL